MLHQTNEDVVIRVINKCDIYLVYVHIMPTSRAAATATIAADDDDGDDVIYKSTFREGGLLVCVAGCAKSQNDVTI